MWVAPCWIKEQTGSFNGGLYFVAGLLVLSAVLTLVVARSHRKDGAPLPVAQH